MSTHPPLRVLVAGGGVAALEAVLALRALAGDRVDRSSCSPRRRVRRAPVVGAARRSAARRRRACRSTACPSSASPAPRRARRGRRRRARGPHHRRRPARLRPADRRPRRARRSTACPGAITFRGPISAGAVEGALRDARDARAVRAPAGLRLAAADLRARAAGRARAAATAPKIAVVSPEPRPLDVFGPIASDALARLLHRAGIEFIGRRRAVEAVGDALVTDDGRMLAADAVIALPRLRGPAHRRACRTTPHGFIDDRRARAASPASPTCSPPAT